MIDRQNPFTLTTSWPDGFDGLLFVDEMKPRTQLPQ
jgi:erythromycin esterase-like protein